MAARSLTGLVTALGRKPVESLMPKECAFVDGPGGALFLNTSPECVAAQERNAKIHAANKSWMNQGLAVDIVSAIAGAVPVIGTASSLAIKAANVVQRVGQTPTTVQNPFITQQLTPGRAPTMGLFDDIWGAATGPGGIFNANNGVNWSNLLNQGANIAMQAFAPQPSAFPMSGGGGGMTATPAMASVPAIAGRVGAVVGRGFFSRFPNLATGIQTLRNGGVNASRSKLYSVMKRFGPEFLVSGGLLTAAAVNELAVAGPGHRRMNPANSKALRRAARRIESFHRLCRHTDMLQTRRRRSKAKC